MAPPAPVKMATAAQAAALHRLFGARGYPGPRPGLDTAARLLGLAELDSFRDLTAADAGRLFGMFRGCQIPAFGDEPGPREGSHVAGRQMKPAPLNRPPTGMIRPAGPAARAGEHAAARAGQHAAARPESTRPRAETTAVLAVAAAVMLMTARAYWPLLWSVLVPERVKRQILLLVLLPAIGGRAQRTRPIRR